MVQGEKGEQVPESHRLCALAIIMLGIAQVNVRAEKRAAGPFNPDRVEGGRRGQGMGGGGGGWLQ